MNVVPSGLIKDGQKLWTINGIPIHEGDLVEQDNILYLAAQNLERYSIFNSLVPIREWGGKTISKVSLLTGLKTAGLPNWQKDSLLIFFSDETISELLLEGCSVVSSCEESEVPNIDVLVRTGIISLETKLEFEKEQELKRSLDNKIDNLELERSELQKSLLSLEPKARKIAYKQIEAIEDQLRISVKQLASYPWRWVYQNRNLEYLTVWNPKLVDIFSWRSNQQDYRQDISKMLDPCGKKIRTIHNIFDATRSKHYSRNVYIIEFEDGVFSTSLGIVSGNKMAIPLTKLFSIGLISNLQLAEANEKMRSYKYQTELKEAKREQLGQLKRELNTMGLGIKRTCNIIEEIKSLSTDI